MELSQTLDEQYSVIHKIMRQIESDEQRNHFNLIEIHFDSLDKALINLKDTIDEKRKKVIPK